MVGDSRQLPPTSFFSGKTVTARAIARGLGGVRIDREETKAERGLSSGGEGEAPPAWEASPVKV